MSRRTLWVLGARFRFLFIKNRMCAPGLLFKLFRAACDEHRLQPHSWGAKSTFKAGSSQGSPDAGEVGDAPGTNVSGSQIGSLAVGDQARAITVIHQGLSLTEAERLFGLLFEQNFPKLAETARVEARRRVDEFAATFTRVAAAQNVTEEHLAGFAEPDVQFVLNAAIQAGARRDSGELRDLLARLIVQRLQVRDDEMMSVVAGEAVSAASKLAPNQLHILALCFVTLYTEWFDGPVTWGAANEFLREMALPFMSRKMSYADLLHIEYVGCGTLTRGPVSGFDNVISRKYVDLFEIEKREMPRHERKPEDKNYIKLVSSAMSRINHESPCVIG